MRSRRTSCPNCSHCTPTAGCPSRNSSARTRSTTSTPPPPRPLTGRRSSRCCMSELMLDVSASVPFDSTTCLAASVHLPDIAGGAPRAVLVCWPGGSYGRAYWDMHIPGHPGYSFAEHLAAQGFLVVAADHLGVGASSKPSDGDRVDFLTVSAAAASFVEQLRALLAEGAPELGGVPLPDTPVIGVGHSLGACLTAVTQARHRSYDAVALLGFTHGRKDVA